MATIKQTVSFKATPEKIYDTLMSSAGHKRITGRPAKISNKLTKFSTFGGLIVGKNLKLVRGKKIVQAWRGKEWKKFSKVTLDFKKTRLGTKLTLTHVLPKEYAFEVRKGWNAYYWKKMKKIFK